MSPRASPNGLLQSCHYEGPGSRRDFLARAGGGFGALALYSLLVEGGVLPRVVTAAEGDAPAGAAPKAPGPAKSLNPLAPKAGHFAGSATSVIFLFMDGGPSHLDTFDHKPAVNDLAGKPLPSTIERVITPMGVTENPLLASKRKWQRYGQSGLEISDWYPHVGECADDLCLVRSCWADGLNHVGSVCQMNTGSILAGRPSLGAWVNYGLGTENQNLPGFVVLLDNDREPPGGNRVWGTGFMPATFQGTRFRNGKTPVLHLETPEGIDETQQRYKLDYINQLNRRHLEKRSGDFALEARIAAYELAFRMQAETPAAVDLADETRATQELYGLDDKATSAFGRNCLLARRLVERGVRFVQLYSGSGSQWDAHSKIEENHSRLCRSTDKPIAGLLKDLKSRGLLERTLVIWGGEFGRTPMSEKGDGRDHNPYGFTMWMAGGGVAGGKVVGATDDFGLKAVDRRVHVRDLHATILELMGLDHTQLIYLHQGRPERPTVNEGRVIDDVLAQVCVQAARDLSPFRKGGQGGSGQDVLLLSARVNAQAHQRNYVRRSPHMIDLQSTSDGIILPVHAQPGARKNGITGVHAGRLKVAVTQAPEKGKANQALVKLLAELLEIKRSQIALVAGETSHHKKFLITGVTRATLEQRLATLSPP